MRDLSVSGRWARAALFLYLAAAGIAALLAFASPLAVDGDGPADIPLYVLILAHALWALGIVVRPARFSRRDLRRSIFVPELLLTVTTLFFLFNYVYALNANMEYVERFVDDGTLRLALDTASERAIAFARFSPFFVTNLIAYLYPRIRRRRLLSAVLTGGKQLAKSERGRVPSAPRYTGTGTLSAQLSIWALPVAGIAAFLQTVAFPGFALLDGIAVLGWIALVPLFLLFRVCSYGRSVFYGTVFGTVLTMASNYWLATFNLVSLQFAVVLFFGYYVVFMLVSLWIFKKSRRFTLLVMPLAWTLFELLRSSGFLGYPWTLLAHSQYSSTALIQVSAITGVWGVSFLVLLVNSAIAESVWRRFIDPWSGRSVPGTSAGSGVSGISAWRPLVATAVLALMVWAGGGIALLADRLRPEPSRTARVALVQQNTDPRQARYRNTLSILRRLTDESLEAEPDLVAWSETAFVPNIRRWAAEDPPGALTGIVNDFLDYQQSIDTWLVTGNDDYEVIRSPEGEEVERNSYNASVLFDDTGARRKTYRKVRLVPFTEYFPYRDALPGIYELLQEFDVHLWEPGQERTVFEHPKFTFSTPICFEDVFPTEIRRFVNAGAEVVLNLTNDYWSLTEVQAKQHFAGAMFRAIENRRPMLRATASGLTSHIDTHGRILGTLPYYEEAWMTAELQLRENPPTTVYTRLGDWFPVLSGIGLFVIAGIELRAERKERAAAVDPRSV